MKRALIHSVLIIIPVPFPLCSCSEIKTVVATQSWWTFIFDFNVGDRRVYLHPFVVSWKQADGVSVLSTQRITFPCSLQQEATCGRTPNQRSRPSAICMSFILSIIMSNIQMTQKICVKEERGGAARRVSRLKPACLLIKILKLSATFVP